MSGTTAAGGPQRRDVVFCHECRQEWYRDEHGLICPGCQSDFVEIVRLPFPSSTASPLSSFPSSSSTAWLAIRRRRTTPLVLRALCSLLPLLFLILVPSILYYSILHFFVLGTSALFTNFISSLGTAPVRRVRASTQIENTDSDPSAYARIPGSFGPPFMGGDDTDEDGDDFYHTHQHHHDSPLHETFHFVEGPNFRVERRTRVTSPGAGGRSTTTERTSTPLGGNNSGSNNGSGRTYAGGVPNVNMLEMVQTIFSNIMGESNYRRAAGQNNDSANSNNQQQQQSQNQEQNQEQNQQQQQQQQQQGFGGYMPGGPRGPPLPPFLFPSTGPTRFVYENNIGPSSEPSAGGHGAGQSTGPGPGPSPQVVAVEDIASVLQQVFGVAAQNDPTGGILGSLMGLGGGRGGGGPGGDYVWSETQLDRVISELMEQHQGNAPPPAPREALDALPTVRIDEQRVNEGEDCVVCKEDFVLDEEVVQLPCKHVYHDFCVKKWLEAHDTCPICRQPTSSHPHNNSQQHYHPTMHHPPQQPQYPQFHHMWHQRQPPQPSQAAQEAMAQAQGQSQSQSPPRTTTRTWGWSFNTTLGGGNININNNNNHRSSSSGDRGGGGGDNSNDNNNNNP